MLTEHPRHLLQRIVPMSSTQIPLFIVSTGRCGSTMLSRMLAMHPQVASISEFFTSLAPWAFNKNPVDGPNLWYLLSLPRANHRIWLRLMERGITIDEFRYPLDRLDRYRESGIPPLLTMTLTELSDKPEELHDALRIFVESLPMANLGTQYIRVMDWFSQQMGRGRWVERSGSSLGFIEPIMHYFPQAKYVHIWRDGREMALSSSKFPPMRLSMVSRDFQAKVGKTMYERIPEKDVPKLPEQYRELVAPNFSVDAYQRLSLPLERFGEVWSNMMCRAMPLLAKLPPDRVLHVQYESLLKKPFEHLQRLVEFLDPSLERDAWAKKAAGLVRSNPMKWTRLPADERARVEKACAPGYDMLARLRIDIAG